MTAPGFFLDTGSIAAMHRAVGLPQTEAAYAQTYSQAQQRWAELSASLSDQLLGQWQRDNGTTTVPGDVRIRLIQQAQAQTQELVSNEVINEPTLAAHSERRNEWNDGDSTFDPQRNYVGPLAPEDISDYEGEFIRDLLRETGVNQDRVVDFVYDGQEQDNGKDGVIEECDPTCPFTPRMIELRNEFLGLGTDQETLATTHAKIIAEWDEIFNAHYEVTFQELAKDFGQADFAAKQIALASAANRAFNRIFREAFTKPITAKLEAEGEWNILTQEWMPKTP